MIQKAEMAPARHDLAVLRAKRESEDAGPQGALVSDSLQDWDHIAVVYSKGNTPPEITIRQESGTVHTVLADGVAVAVVARASGPAPTVEDVLLVEREK